METQLNEATKYKEQSKLNQLLKIAQPCPEFLEPTTEKACKSPITVADKYKAVEFNNMVSLSDPTTSIENYIAGENSTCSIGDCI